MSFVSRIAGFAAAALVTTASQGITPEEAARQVLDAARAAQDAAMAQPQAAAGVPTIEQKAKEGAAFCGLTEQQMLEFRKSAVQFKRIDPQTNEAVLTYGPANDRKEHRYKEADFGAWAMGIAQEAPGLRGAKTEACAKNVWAGHAVQQATMAP